MSVKILKKISVATMSSLDLKRNPPKPEDGEIAVMRLVGLVRSYELGETQFGAYFAFKGEFQATDLQTGEVGIGPVAFLPAPLDTALKSLVDDAVEHVQEANAESKTRKRVFAKGDIEVGFDVFVKHHASEIGYQYILKTLADIKVSDPLASLTARFGKPALAIAAPAKQQAVVEEPKAVESETEKVAKPGKKS